ncbi:MAG: hypothetical protein GEV07_11670 [Streptosporangiales bacterium]|nr:hypothetical protein [Streptosporangiales bacterium]
MTVSELIDRISDKGLHVAYMVHGTTPYPWTSIRLYDEDPQEHFIVTVRYAPEIWPVSDT